MRPVRGLRDGLRGSARLGLEVAVDEAGLVRRGQAAAGRGVDREDLAGGPLALVQPRPRGHAGDELHGDEQLAAGLAGAEGADVVDRDDVGVGEPGQGPGLAQQAEAVGRAGPEAQQLERDLAVELGVVGGVDHAHAAAAELREHDVAADHAAAGQRLVAVDAPAVGRALGRQRVGGDAHRGVGQRAALRRRRRRGSCARRHGVPGCRQ